MTTKNLQRLIEEIEKGKRNSVSGKDLEVYELLAKNKDGITFLEYLFDKDISLDYDLMKKIKDNVEIGYYFVILINRYIALNLVKKVCFLL